MPFNAKTKEDDELYRCAKFCHEIVHPLLEVLPRTRESQATLVEFLQKRITESECNFSISKKFLINRVGFSDHDLIDNWNGTPTDLAWLMVHEQLSNYFCRFIIDNWNIEVYLIHNVPKTAGTSVCDAVYRQSWFVAYPQTTFGFMTQTTGLLGFALQLAEFEESRPDRLYIGGHYNLPDMLARLGIANRCRGISLTRSPTVTMSSAVRYVWTRVEAGDPNWTEAYPSLDSAKLSSLRDAIITSDDSAVLAAMRSTIEVIMEASQFQENYADLLSKYYYNDEIQDIFSLCRLFDDNRGLTPCIDAARDEDLICRQLGIDGPLPRLNASLFSHRQLARAFGGDDAFGAFIAPASLRSAEIYGALCVLHARSLVPAESGLETD